MCPPSLTQIPCLATSCDAEHAFSRGRLTVSRLRHSLADESVRANTLLGSWALLDGIVPERKIIKTFDKREEADLVDAAAEPADEGSSKPRASLNLVRAATIPKPLQPPGRKAAGPSRVQAPRPIVKSSSTASAASGKGKARASAADVVELESHADNDD